MRERFLRKADEVWFDLAMQSRSKPKPPKRP